MTIAETAEELESLGSATLGECGALRMHPRIKPVWQGAVVAGPAITARVRQGDNLAIHVAVAENIIVGTVLVVDATNPPEYGYWGEVLTTAAGRNDIAGLVIDGGARDIDAIEALEFPVFSALVALTGRAEDQGRRRRRDGHRRRRRCVAGRLGGRRHRRRRRACPAASSTAVIEAATARYEASRSCSGS